MVARGRPGAGPRLVSIQKKNYASPIWFIRWHQGNHTRERSTGTGDRVEAELIFARWLIDRGKGFDRPKGVRYPSEMSIDEALVIYMDGHVDQLAAPERLVYAVPRLMEWWGVRTVDVRSIGSVRAASRRRPRRSSRSSERRSITV